MIAGSTLAHSTKSLEQVIPMPILKQQPDIWPLDLLGADLAASNLNHTTDSDNAPSKGNTVSAASIADLNILDEHSEMPPDWSGDTSAPGLQLAGSGVEMVDVVPIPETPDDPNNWWALYTLARFEKKLMRQLLEQEIPFFGPTIECRRRSPQGRVRVSYEPLFPNYVFIRGCHEARYRAVCTGSVSRWMPVPNPHALVTDLRQIRQLILTGAPLAPERRLVPGQKVRVKSGPFKGFEGTIVRREKEIRLMVYVRYMGQGASVVLDDCQVEAL